MLKSDISAVCPGGEGAVLKTVEPKGFAGSNPVGGVREGSFKQAFWVYGNMEEYFKNLSTKTLKPYDIGKRKYSGTLWRDTSEARPQNHLCNPRLKHSTA